MNTKGILHQFVQFEHTESDLHQLFEVKHLVRIEHQHMFAITKAKDFNAVSVLTVKVRTEIDSANFCPERQ